MTGIEGEPSRNALTEITLSLTLSNCGEALKLLTTAALGKLRVQQVV